LNALAPGQLAACGHASILFANEEVGRGMTTWIQQDAGRDLPMLRADRLLLKGGPSSDMISTANWTAEREAELVDSIAYLMENGASYSWLEFR